MTLRSPEGGESTTVEAVIVENLTKGTSLDLKGTDILRLTSEPSGIEVTEIPITKPILYPNPAVDRGTLVFDAGKEGKIRVTLSDLSGNLLNVADFTVEKGRYSVSLPAMPMGTFVVAVNGAGINYSFKWMCTGNGNGSGNIVMNNAAGHPLPVVATRSEQSDAKVIEMLYEAGDLLRFTGTNGKMRTIVMNQPTCSHDITFDFYACTDGAGYNYTIVRAGDLLWMVEDLRYVGKTIVPLMSSTTQWKQYDKSKPMAAYYNFSDGNAPQGAYYNFAGAKAALPAGWQLPTAGEVDNMLTALGGYQAASNKLKLRGDASMWLTGLTDLDSISIGIQPYGWLTPESAFEMYEISARYMTRSTIKQKPICFEVSDANPVALDPKVAVADLGYGFKVRGCRVAPSPYDDMMKLFSSKDKANAPIQRAKLFESGPLGQNYTYGVNKQKIISNAGTRTERVTSITQPIQQAVLRKDNYSAFLKKSAAQSNDNGRQNMVIALFSRDGSKSFENLSGTGYVSLVIYGDSTQNYARIDSLRLPTEFTMPVIARNELRDGTIFGEVSGGKFTRPEYICIYKQNFAE